MREVEKETLKKGQNQFTHNDLERERGGEREREGGRDTERERMCEPWHGE